MLNTPFFSIGVTTYRRHQELREALQSILSQDEVDYEVIVGNDCPEDPIQLDQLGITDPRIRIINRGENMGEIRNMELLVLESKGHYFTWLGDDDFFSKNHLSRIKTILLKHPEVDAVFTSYHIHHGIDYVPIENTANSIERIYAGREFLERYFKGECRIISTYGIFKRDKLLTMGGLKNLSTARVGLYGEYDFLVRFGKLDWVAYVDTPSIIYRFHPGCGAVGATDDEQVTAGLNLVRNCLQYLSDGLCQSRSFLIMQSIFRLIFSGLQHRLSDRPLKFQMQKLRAFRRQLLMVVTQNGHSELNRMAQNALRLEYRRAIRYWLSACVRTVIPNRAMTAIRTFIAPYRKKKTHFWN